MQHDTPVQSPTADDAALDVVLTYAETAKMLRVSIRTLDRMRETGEAPPHIQLTGRRIGFWKRDVRDWLLARTAPRKRAA